MGHVRPSGGDPPFEWIEHAPVPAYAFRVAGDDFVLEHVNAEARRAHPAIAQMLGRPMLALYGDQPALVAAARQALDAGVARDITVPLRRYDEAQATQYQRLVFVPLGDRLVIYALDQRGTDQQAVALRETEARYNTVVGIMPEAVVLRALDGRVLAANERAAQLFGFADVASLVGTNGLPPHVRFLTEAGDPTDPDGYPGIVRRLDGPLGTTVYALECADAGARRWVGVAAQPIRGEDGEPVGSVATYADVTQRVLERPALREGAERLDLALSAGRMGAFEYTLSTDVGQWSANLDTVFDLPPRAPGMAAWIAHLHPDDRAGLLEHAHRIAQATDVSSVDHECRIVGRDGHTRWARLRGQVGVGPDGPFVRGTVQDVTEQRKLEEELRRAHRLESIGRLAGGVAHDFNNLLAAILGTLDLVDEVAPPALAEDLATVRHAALRARDLTRQLLAFARKQPVEFKKVDVAVMVRDVERMLQRMLGPDVALSIHCAPDVWVRADRSLLEQVLVNFAVNAREAMPHGGRLTITTEPRVAPDGMAQVSIEVADSGQGMDDETVRHVFDPFFTTKTSGHGLGLASSYGIVKQHGGDIVVRSRLGEGTCFTVTLPRWIEAGAAPPPRTVAPPARPGRGCVLVVDDEELVRKTALRILKSLGYETLSAADGEEALAQVKAHEGDIDVLLCDVAMPGRSGPAVARDLLALRPTLKVVFASGYTDLTGEDLLPGSVFLRKPYLRGDLAALLQQVLEQGPASSVASP